MEMEFVPADPNENFDTLRLVSKGGRWEIGIWSVMFGKRVRLGRVGAMCCNLDYCAGPDKEKQALLLKTVRDILSILPEEISGSALERIFPIQENKPVFNDTYCWPELQRLAEAARKGT